MKWQHLDDASYVLLHRGGDGSANVLDLTLSGWTDRAGLLCDGVRNPVPISLGQRECWGMHWLKLRPLDELAGRARKRTLVQRLTDWLRRRASNAVIGRIVVHWNSKYGMSNLADHQIVIGLAG